MAGVTGTQAAAEVDADQAAGTCNFWRSSRRTPSTPSDRPPKSRSSLPRMGITLFGHAGVRAFKTLHAGLRQEPGSCARRSDRPNPCKGCQLRCVGPKQVSITRHCHARRARGESAQRGSGRFRQALVPALAKDSGRCRPSARPDPASLVCPLSSKKLWLVQSRCVPVSSLPGRHHRAIGPAPGDAAARRGRARTGAAWRRPPPAGGQRPGNRLLPCGGRPPRRAGEEEGLSSLDARVINGLGSAFGSPINYVSTSLIPRSHHQLKPSCPASMIRARPLLPRNRQAPPPVRWRGVPADLTRGIHRWMQSGI